MKNFILLFTAALFVGCTSSGVQVTTDDEKSQAIKAVYDGYLANDFTASNELYSDDTAIYVYFNIIGSKSQNSFNIIVTIILNMSSNCV